MYNQTCQYLFNKGKQRERSGCIDLDWDLLEQVNQKMGQLFQGVYEDSRVPNGKQDEDKYNTYCQMVVMAQRLFQQGKVTCTHPKENLCVHTVVVDTQTDLPSFFNEELDKRKDGLQLLISISDSFDITFDKETENVLLFFGLEDMYT